MSSIAEIPWKKVDSVTFRRNVPNGGAVINRRGSGWQFNWFVEELSVGAQDGAMKFADVIINHLFAGQALSTTTLTTMTHSTDGQGGGCGYSATAGGTTTRARSSSARRIQQAVRTT